MKIENITKRNGELYIGNMKIYGYIYKIENMVNGKVYIGQSTMKFNERYKGSKWWKYSSSEYLKNSSNKYGINSFKINIMDIAFSIKELDTKEKLYICMYSSCNRMYGYNRTAGGGGTKGYFHTKETRKKMSETHKIRMNCPEVKKALSISVSGENNPMYGIRLLGNKNGMYGKKHSIKSINKISKTKKERYVKENHPMYGKSHSKETKDKISNANTGRTHSIETKIKRSIPIVQLSLDFKYINKFNGLRFCEEAINIKHGSISAVCKGKPKHKTAGGYIFLYEEDYNYFIENNIPTEEWREYLQDKYKKKE